MSVSSILTLGDSLKVMQKLVDDGVQVDSIVTDPPYELGFMGKDWDSTGITFHKEIWELAMKLLKPGGHLLAFSASRNYHRMAVAIEDAGFEIRDQLMWLYGSGFPKSLNVGKAVDKKLGNEREDLGNYKTPDGNQELSTYNNWKDGEEQERRTPRITRGNTEYEGWGTALKPAHEPIVVARKPLSEKSVADNVLKYGTGAINIDACRIELNGDYKSKANGRPSLTGLKDNYDSEKANIPDTIGRFPANVMHDGLQEDWARYFYSPKTSKAERGEDNTHPTVKPQELMKYLCRLVTPKGGTVLDPFMGSGSTGMAAKDEGFGFIGIEREKEYFEIAEGRITATAPLTEFME